MKTTHCGGEVKFDEKTQVFDKLQKYELIKLQRKYRQLGGDTTGPVGHDSSDKFGRQKNLARQLLYEKENLKLDLEIVTSIRNKNIATFSEKKVEKICQKYEKFRQQIEDDLDEVNDMEHELDKIIKRIVQQKFKIQKIYNHTITQEHVSKFIEDAKNRLRVLTTAYNTQCSTNQDLRREINENLLIRTRFFYRQKWYRKAYNETKLMMNKVTESTIKRYDSRDDSVMKTKALIIRNDRESKLHVLEIKDLQRVLHQNEQNNKFLKKKNSRRILIEPDWARRKRRYANKYQDLEETLLNYRKAFKDVLRLGKSNNLETMVNTYRSQEQKNFAHVKYLMDLYNEIMVHKTSVMQLKKALSYHSQVFNVRKKAEKVVLKGLLTEVEKKQEISKTYMEEMHSSEVHMEKLIQGIQNVFDGAKCDTAPVLHLLVPTDSLPMRIIPSNIMLCLNVLEHQIDHLKNRRNLLRVKALMKEGNLPKLSNIRASTLNIQTGLKHQNAGGPFRPKVIFTGPMAFDDDDEEEKLFSKRAFTHAEMVDYCQLKIRTAEALTKKYSNMSIHDSEDDLTGSVMTIQET